MTPSELNIYARIHKDKSLEETKEKVTLAYLTALWTIQWLGKKHQQPRPLKEILATIGKERKVMTDEQMLERVKQLNALLGGEVKVIGSSKKLNGKIGADFSALYKEMNNAQKRMNSFQKGMKKALAGLGAVLGGLAVGKLIKDSTQMAMGVETAIENINHNMGQAAKAFQDWVETQSKSFGMAKADAYNYGSIFSNLLDSFTSSAQETAEQTQELMKAAAIIASRTGRTYDDVANRIRSGMLGSTEAIEELGVYTNISVLQSTEAFRRLAGDKSWAQLDFRTQQQIRLAAILEQTYKRYGDTLADTTQTRQAQFVASLKNIQLSLGQAFLPIYNAVLPALTTMANAIGRVVNLIAQFTTALFGTPKQAQTQASAIQQQASAMTDLGAATAGAGKAAKKAAKDAKGALAGFDEINQLAQKTADASGGAGDIGGGIGTISTPALALDTGGFASATVEVSEKIQAMADRIKSAISSVKNFINENKTAIISALAGIGTGIGVYLIGTHWTKIVAVVKTAMSAVGGALSSISVPILGVAALIGLIVAAVVDLWQNNEEFRNKVVTAWNGIKDTLSNIWETILKPIFEAIKEVLTDVWNNGIKPLWNKWKDFIEAVVYLMTDLWNGMKPVVDWVVRTFGPVIVEIFKGVFRQIKNVITLIIEIVGSIITSFTGIVNGVRKIFNGLIDFIAGVFTGDWRRAWDGVKQIFKGVFDSLWGIVKVPLNLIIDGINWVIGGLNKISFSLPSWIPGVGGKSFGINIPKIPKLARGGIVTAPTLAMIGERGKKEAVLPLEQNTGWMDTLAAKIAAVISGQSGGEEGPWIIQVMIGGNKILEEVVDAAKRKNAKAGRTVIPVGVG